MHQNQIYSPTNLNQDKPPLNNWIGKWLISVAILHLLMGFIFLGEPLRKLLLGGSGDSVADASTGTAAFYLCFSLLLLVVAISLDNLQAKNKNFPAAFAVAFLAIVLVFVILKPVSGFWLGLPPAVFLVFKTCRRGADTGSTQGLQNSNSTDI